MNKCDLVFLFRVQILLANMGNKRSYTISFKLDVISYAEKTSNRKASLFYQVDRKRVQEWRKQKKELEVVKNDHNSSIDKVRALPGRGSKAKYPTVEKELLDYVKKKREERMSVTTSMIRRKAKELGETLNIQGAKFSSGWVERFMRRNKLVERVRTQYAQKLPEDTPLVVKEFLQTAREKTKDIEKKFIISFDETPMWFDMPRNTTIDFEGVREVPIKTTGNEKLRFTVVLGYTASGEKLPPAVIFKLKKKPKGRFPRDVVVTTAPCANMIGDLMISTYIPRVIRARPNGFFKSKGLIFVDRHSSHICDDVVKALKMVKL